jgi:hypothetical protein
MGIGVNEYNSRIRRYQPEKLAVTEHSIGLCHHILLSYTKLLAKEILA